MVLVACFHYTNKPIPEGNVTAERLMMLLKFLIVQHLIQLKLQTRRHQMHQPLIQISLKRWNIDTISVTTDPNTHVDIVDKDGNIIGSGTTDEQGHVTITPNVPT